jgi:hypothetical protein
MLLCYEFKLYQLIQRFFKRELLIIKYLIYIFKTNVYIIEYYIYIYIYATFISYSFNLGSTPTTIHFALFELDL